MPARQSPQSPPPSPPRRGGDLVFLGAAIGLILVVGVLALVFGVVRAPAIPRMTGEQAAALPGGIAWTEYDERAGCTDLWIARTDGDVGPVICVENLDRVVGWTADGIYTVRWGERGEILERRNPVTGEIVETLGVLLREEEPTEHSDYATERHDGDLAVVSDTGHAVWRIACDARYDIGTIVASPDLEYLAATDSAERLLLIDVADESAVVWATGLYEWSWAYLVWEGTEPPGVE